MDKYGNIFFNNIWKEEFLMTDLQAIDARCSRRTYLEIPIELEKLLIIKTIISECNLKSGLNIELVENAKNVFNSLIKSYGMYKGVSTIIVIKANKNTKYKKEKAGYYGERIVLEATKLGLGTCFVGTSFNRKSNELNIGDDEELICVISIGNVSGDKKAFESIMYKVMHERTKSIDEILDSDVEPPEWMIEGIKAVQKAPSALNTQKVRFRYWRGELTAFVNSESMFNLTDLGVAKLHFEIAAGGKFDLGNYGKYTR